MKLLRLMMTVMLATALMLSAQGTATKTKDAGAAKDKAAEKSNAVANEAGAAKKDSAGKAKAAAAPAAADQCTAMTKDGDRCKRKSSAGSKFCWQHGGKKKAS